MVFFFKSDAAVNPKISVYIGALCFASKTSGESAKSYINSHIINVDENTCVIHGILYPLLLNATTVTNFKKTLRTKKTMQ